MSLSATVSIALEDNRLAEYTLDCKDLRCPMPIVQINQSMKSMAIGERLRVEANDPAFKEDLEAWRRRVGHALIEFHDGRVQRAVLEKH